jgi:ABC-2 type transport system permease protein
MVMFLMVSGYTFVFGVNQNSGTTESMITLLFGAELIWLTFLVSVVCMRMFSEERRHGTLETLATVPVTEAQVVLGKFAGAISFLLLVAAPSITFVFILDYFCPGVKGVDVGSLLGGMLILSLIIGSCTAVGTVVSLLTRNMIVSFIAISCAIWCLLLFGDMLGSIPGLRISSSSAWVYSVASQLDEFCRGSIDLRAIVMHLSGTAFLLFVSIKLLESRRWQ